MELKLNFKKQELFMLVDIAKSIGSITVNYSLTSLIKNGPNPRESLSDLDVDSSGLKDLMKTIFSGGDVDY